MGPRDECFTRYLTLSAKTACPLYRILKTPLPDVKTRNTQRAMSCCRWFDRHLIRSSSDVPPPAPPISSHLEDLRPVPPISMLLHAR